MKVNTEAWDNLMQLARLDAQKYEERRKVMGIRLSPRTARTVGSNWEYAQICGTECPVCMKWDKENREAGK